MNASEFLFIAGFIVGLVILLVKLYNIFSGGTLYDWRLSVLMFVTYFLAFGVVFVTFLVNYEVVLYAALFKFMAWLILLNVLFTIAEIFYLLRDVAEMPVKAYNAKEAQAQRPGGFFR